MFVDRIARRYSRALLEVAIQKHLESKIALDMHNLHQVFNEMPDLILALRNPAVSREERIELAKKVAKAARLSDMVGNLLQVLVKNDRVKWIPEIAVGYQEEFDRHTGTVRSDVITAKPLSSLLKMKLQRILQKHLGAKRIVLQTKVEPEILGGLKVVVGDRIYDMSVAGYLDRLEQHLVEEV